MYFGSPTGFFLPLWISSHLWLTAVAFRFTRPAFHRGRSGYFTFGQREHMPTCKIAVHESVMSHDTDYRPYDLAVRSRVIIIDRFAIGLAFLQGYTRLQIIFQSLHCCNNVRADTRHDVFDTQGLRL